MSCRSVPVLKRISGYSVSGKSRRRYWNGALFLTMKRKSGRGEWTVQKKVLFPGYVFVATEDMDQLYQSLKSVAGLTKLLGTGREVVPLTEEEKQFMLDFGGEEQVVPMSEGIIENSVTKILSGPLKGKEGLIRKIDRHKRKAWLEVEMFGRKQEIEVGVEIVAKTV